MDYRADRGKVGDVGKNGGRRGGKTVAGESGRRGGKVEAGSGRGTGNAVGESGRWGGKAEAGSGHRTGSAAGESGRWGGKAEAGSGSRTGSAVGESGRWGGKTEAGSGRGYGKAEGGRRGGQGGHGDETGGKREFNAGNFGRGSDRKSAGESRGSLRGRGNEKGRGGYAAEGTGKRGPEAFPRQGQKNGGGRSLCPAFGKCGGCQLINMEYKKQLEWKQKLLEEKLKGICTVKTVIGMKDPFHYRNKVHAVFDCDHRGRPISGVYQENTHIVVPVENCLIEDRKSAEIIRTIRGMLKSFKIRTYDEDTGYGLLRHVLVRRGFVTGEIMVVLVTASPVFPSKNNFVKALREKHPEITTIIQNVNGRGTSMVLGDKEHVLFGKGYIEDVLCGCRFRISSKSFYQVNPVQTEVLYNKALELAGLTGKETVVDAYCGIGTIGLIASKKAGKVIGVELNPDAVKDAVVNAKLNEIENVKFYCNDAGRFLVNMAERGETVDVVIMDPPRSGSTEEFMDAIGKIGPKKVVYVSCSPETLGRDLRYMKKLGYGCGEAWGVDMFGGTKHCEVCVELCRK